MSNIPVPEVAVVITCFNLGRTIDEALGSIREQTRSPSEVLIVDDGSTDIYTRQVLARLEAGGARVVRTANAGVSAARNVGIRLTSSPYMVLLDADDVLEPTYLERAAAYLDHHPEMAFVSCAMRSFGANEGIWTPPPPTLVSVLTGEVIHVSSMFRREVWDAVGGFDETLFGHEEVDFWTTVLEKGFTGGVIPDPLFRYRVRRGSMAQRAIQRGAHTKLMETIYRKHKATIEENAEELLLAKEKFIAVQVSHQAHLESRRQQVEAELHQVNSELAQVVAELRQVGRSAVEFGDLRRTSPVSPLWGLDRGIPLDRYYIEGFLASHREAVRGRVLEIKDPGYTRTFGADRVTVADVLDIDSTNPDATIIGDLTGVNGMLDDTYDCFILTQTLGVIYDVRAAIREAFRVLKPGGVLLCTVPAAGRINYEEGQDLDGDFWRFTEASIRRLFADVFPPDAFEVTGFGNVLACTAFLYGLSPDELTKAELDQVDPFFPVVYGVRAVKRAPAAVRDSGTVHGIARASEEFVGLVLTYHRVSNGIGLRELCITPDTFRAHMKHLHAEGYAIIPLPELRSRLAADNVRLSGNGKGSRAVAITFDDGYAETRRWAAPILREFSVPATYFIVGSTLDGLQEFWWDALARVFTGQDLPDRLSLTLPATRLDLSTSTPAEREHACQTITQAFYMLTRHARDGALRQILEWAGEPSEQDRQPDEMLRPMTAAEVAALAGAGDVTIGAHTESHVWLPVQPPLEQVAEVQTTKGRLESLTGREVTSFSYPYGGVDPNVVETVRRAGFHEAVTSDDRLVRLGDDPLLIPRIDVGGCDLDAFTSRLRRAWKDDR